MVLVSMQKETPNEAGYTIGRDSQDIENFETPRLVRVCWSFC